MYSARLLPALMVGAFGSATLAQDQISVNLGAQVSGAFQISPTSTETVTVHESGSVDGNYFMSPLGSIDYESVNHLFAGGACDGADLTKSAFVNVMVRPLSSDIDEAYIRGQIAALSKQVNNVSVMPYIAARGRFAPQGAAATVVYSDPGIRDATWRQDIEDKLPSPFTKESPISFGLKQTCGYWDAFRKPETGYYKDLYVEYIVPVNSYKRSLAIYSLAGFVGSSESQEVFSDQGQTGKLNFVQRSESSAPGFLGSIFGSNDAETEVSGSMADSRSRWVTADTVREMISDYLVNLDVSVISDGLPAQEIRNDILKQYLDIFVTKVKAMPLKPEYSSPGDFAITEPPLSSEQFSAIADILGSGSGSSEVRVGFNDCQEAVETIVAAWVGGGAGAAAESAQDELEESSDASGSNGAEQETVQTVPAEGGQNDPAEGNQSASPSEGTSPQSGECKVGSDAGAMSGLHVKFDGQQNTFVPTKIDLYLISNENYRSQLRTTLNQIQLQSSRPLWMVMPIRSTPSDEMIKRITVAEQKIIDLADQVKNRKVKDVMIKACNNGCACPAGYEKAPTSTSNGDLNQGASGRFIYLCVLR